MNAINPKFVMMRRHARRLAMQFAQPYLDEPTCRRRALESLKAKGRNLDKDHIVAAVCCVCLVSLFFIGG